MTGDALGIDIFDKKWEDDEVWNHSMSYGKGKHTGQKRYDGSEPLPNPHTGTEVQKKIYNYFKILQGVRKWNVFFESVPVAKLLDILTGSDAFRKVKTIYFDIQV